MIPYMVGNLAPNSSYLTRVFVKYVPGRDYFRAVPSLNGDKFVTSPPPPQSLSGSSAHPGGNFTVEKLPTITLDIILFTAAVSPEATGKGRRANVELD